MLQWNVIWLLTELLAATPKRRGSKPLIFIIYVIMLVKSSTETLKFFASGDDWFKTLQAEAELLFTLLRFILHKHWRALVNNFPCDFAFFTENVAFFFPSSPPQNLNSNSSFPNHLFLENGIDFRIGQNHFQLIQDCNIADFCLLLLHVFLWLI